MTTLTKRLAVRAASVRREQNNQNETHFSSPTYVMLHLQNIFLYSFSFLIFSDVFIKLQEIKKNTEAHTF